MRLPGRRRASSASKTSRGARRSMARIPWRLTATWIGPHGPGIVVAWTGASGWVGTGSRIPGWYTPGEYDDTDSHGDRSGNRGGTRHGGGTRDDRPLDRGHDLRVVRQPDRALPQEDAGRRGRGRQPRDRGRDDPVPARRRGHGRARRRDRGRRL